jgi:glycosyltransferase involved in cell wall biosynthesis
MKLSLIVPAHNEENRISSTLHNYISRFCRERFDFELLVIIDGQDNTTKVVEELAKNEKRLRYFIFPKNLGKGGAIIEGFKLADKNSTLIGFIDADGSIDAENFIRLIHGITNYDGAIASRKIAGAKIITKSSIFQRLGSRGFNLMTKVLLGLRFADTQCGAKLFKATAIKNIVNNLSITNFAFDVDLLCALKKNKCSVEEIPVTWVHKIDSKFNFEKFFMREVLTMFQSLLKIRAK